MEKLRRKEISFKEKTGNLTFQLISDEDFAVEGDFELKQNEKAILAKLGGKYNDEFKYWAFNKNSYHEIYESLQKAMKGRSTYPITTYPIETILKVDFNQLKIQITNDKSTKVRVLDYSRDINKSINNLPKNLYNKLYDFQRAGVEFAVKNKGRCIIADEMGVGKTIQAIAISYIYRADWPVLILCPSSLKYNWEDEILTWLKGKVQQHEVQVLSNGKEKISKAKFIIVSYDLSKSPKIKDQIKKKEFQFVIADETHYLKNPKAERTIVNIPILRQSKRVLLLSGTPILSKPEECYEILSALRPDMFDNFVRYGARYCDPKRSKFIYNFNCY